MSKKNLIAILVGNINDKKGIENQLKDISEYAEIHGYRIADIFTLESVACKRVGDELKCLFGLIQRMNDKFSALCFNKISDLKDDSRIYLAPIFKAALDNNMKVLSVEKGQFTAVSPYKKDVSEIEKALFPPCKTALLSIIVGSSYTEAQDNTHQEMVSEAIATMENQGYEIKYVFTFNKNCIDEDRYMSAKDSVLECDSFIIFQAPCFGPSKEDLRITGMQINVFDTDDLKSVKDCDNLSEFYDKVMQEVLD